MRSGNLLFSAVQLFMVAAILTVGLFFWGIVHVPHFPLLLMSVFSKSSAFFSLAGYGLIFLGLLLLIGFFVMHRGRYYQVRMQAGDAQIDLELLHTYIEKFWKESFFHPESEVKDVIVYGNRKIEIVAKLPDLPVPEQKATLLRIEQELGALLARKFGYPHSFLLTITKED
jgi:hypothetical protein